MPRLRNFLPADIQTVSFINVCMVVCLSICLLMNWKNISTRDQESMKVKNNDWQVEMLFEKFGCQCLIPMPKDQ